MWGAAPAPTQGAGEGLSLVWGSCHQGPLGAWGKVGGTFVKHTAISSPSDAHTLMLCMCTPAPCTIAACGHSPLHKHLHPVHTRSCTSTPALLIFTPCMSTPASLTLTLTPSTGTPTLLTLIPVRAFPPCSHTLGPLPPALHGPFFTPCTSTHPSDRRSWPAGRSHHPTRPPLAHGLSHCVCHRTLPTHPPSCSHSCLAHVHPGARSEVPPGMTKLLSPQAYLFPPPGLHALLTAFCAPRPQTPQPPTHGSMLQSHSPPHPCRHLSLFSPSHSAHSPSICPSTPSSIHPTVWSA